MKKTPNNAPGYGPRAASRRQVVQSAAALSGAAILAACSLPGQTAPPRQFRLTPKSTFDAGLPSVDWALLVLRPEADRVVDTTRITLVSGGLETQVYANSEWADRAPAMVQRLLVESFVNSGGISVVGSDRSGLRPDYRLKTVLREFQAEGSPGSAPNIRVGIDASLVQMPRRNVVGTTSVQRTEQASSDRIEDIIAAYDNALGGVFKELVTWTLVTGEEAGGAAS